MKILFICLFTFCSLQAETFIDGEFPKMDLSPYRSPTLRQLDYEGLETIKRNVSPSYWDFWMKIVKQEERGLFGYHAAKQKYRIFQDIVKMIMEEIVGFEIKKDFHFFRIPLDPDLDEHAIAQDFLTTYSDPFDAIPHIRDQIISLNYSLFGNYTDGSQCSVCYFIQNKSWFNIFYEEKLRFLFNALGLPTSEISSLFQIGDQINYVESGVMYQFFDSSHHKSSQQKEYALVDAMAYPSGVGAPAAGYLNKNANRYLSKDFLAHQKAKFDLNGGQIRLLMNTETTLNPYGPLSMRRYDLLDPELVSNYEKALRQKIRELPRDPLKVDAYKQQLKALWGV